MTHEEMLRKGAELLARLAEARAIADEMWRAGASHVLVQSVGLCQRETREVVEDGVSLTVDAQN